MNSQDFTIEQMIKGSQANNFKSPHNLSRNIYLSLEIHTICTHTHTLGLLRVRTVHVLLPCTSVS